IEVNALSYSFNAHQAIQFPNWKVASDMDALILGPSGSGKTTLVHLLSGMLTPSEGEIMVNGHKIHLMSTADMDQFRRSHVGIVFQQPHLIKSLTVMENLQLARYLANQPNDDAWIFEIMERLGLSALKDQNVKKISHGQSQRVAIARAVVNRPAILFGDEPTASLDDENCEMVIALLKEQARHCRASLIIATHDQRVKQGFTNQLVLKEHRT
ncbi:unnamed protein product, partial [Chrysoparadoxa australica]